MRYVVTLATTIEDVISKDRERFQGLLLNEIYDVICKEAEHALKLQLKNVVKIDESRDGGAVYYSIQV